MMTLLGNLKQQKLNGDMPTLKKGDTQFQGEQSQPEDGEAIPADSRLPQLQAGWQLKSSQSVGSLQNLQMNT